MHITYTDKKNFSTHDLQQLFQSVNWLSANYPDRLKKALDNCETVFTAWDELIKYYSRKGFQHIDERYVFTIQKK